jgi:hypothetical protein
MKTHVFIIILTLIFFNGCKDGKTRPFNHALLDAVLEAKDSLKSKDSQLLSIEFYNQERYERGCIMKVFTSNCYASAYIDAYAKIGKTTIAIYNIRDDIYETINKNEIIFFMDTIVGYKDTCVLFETTEKIFYSIHKSDSITKFSYPFDDFPAFRPLRIPNCKSGATLTIPVPKSDWFYLDSLQAEKEVEYYRSKGKKFNSSPAPANL